MITKVLQTIADQLRKQIFAAVKVAYPDAQIKLEYINLEHPAAEEHGDYSTNVALKVGSREQGVGSKKNPREIAEEIVAQLQETTSLEGVEVAGAGFINFTLSTDTLVTQMGQVLEAGESYGGSSARAGKTVVIDYSAPNIARRFGVGHLRSTIIGQALYNLYRFLGYKVAGDNHLGDWGTQFGKLMFMIETENLRDLTVEKLEELYVRFHKLAGEDPKLEEKGREWFQKLEKGDLQARELWQKCVAVSMEEFNKIYALLGIKIDYTYGESFYEDKMAPVINKAKEKGLGKQSQGAWIMEIPGIKAPLILVKSDGATTYATRDLAALEFRQKTWKPAMIIYEVGVDQTLHFQQVFAAARMLKLVRPETELVHTKHGMYRWAHGRFRTREGNTPKLEEVLHEAINRAKKLGSEDEETAKAVGIGAIKYFDLKHNVQGDIVFDWEKIFNLEGDSGPYLQYTYARARSVIRKAETENLKFKITNLKTEELAVLRYLYRFPEVVEAAARQYAPNLVCSYLFGLAKRFNGFYNNCPIIVQSRELGVPDSELQTFRLGLTEATAIVLKNGLNILGIQALERM